MPSLSKIAAAKDDSCDILAVSSGLTALGFHLATLPVDPRVGKMMIYGALFGCIDPALTIAAAMSARNPFMSPFDKSEEADARRKEFSTEGSDHLTTLRAFNDWRELRKRKGDRSAQTFLRDNFLSTPHSVPDRRPSGGNSPICLSTLAFYQRSFDVIQSRSRGGGRGGNIIRSGKISKMIQDPTRTQRTCSYSRQFSVRAYIPILSLPHARSSKVLATKRLENAHFPLKKVMSTFIRVPVSLQESKARHRYACYHEIVKTSKIYVRDCTTVTEFALLLFGGNLKVYHQYGVVAVDEWLKFRIAAKPATLVKYLRTQTEIMLLRKIVCPEDDITESSEGKALIEAVSTLLATEIGGAVEGPDRSAADIVRPWTGDPDGGRNYSGGRAGGRGGKGGRGTRGGGGRGRGGGGGGGGVRGR